MYKRCIVDENGLEPRKLYNLVVFMMYNIRVEYDQEGKQTERRTLTGEITVEDTLEILFVRHGRAKLDAEIDEIFGEIPKGQEDQPEKKIKFNDYIQKINQRAMKERQERKKEMKKNLQNKGKEEGVA
jgi:hypothetical protein